MKTKYKDTWFYRMNEKMDVKSALFLYFLGLKSGLRKVERVRNRPDKKFFCGFYKKSGEKVWRVNKKQYLCIVKTERVVLLKVWTMV